VTLGDVDASRDRESFRRVLTVTIMPGFRLWPIASIDAAQLHVGLTGSERKLADEAPSEPLTQLGRQPTPVRFLLYRRIHGHDRSA